MNCIAVRWQNLVEYDYCNFNSFDFDYENNYNQQTIVEFMVF
jgi:hypothetical protein